ncbi:MAG: hypothetical protein ACTSY1_05955 [Alphaproteobacteria bacterium]
MNRGVPLSQAAMCGDLQWLAIAWAVRNWTQVVACGPSERQGEVVPLAGANMHWPGNLPAPDPTCGATHFHRHDELPPWAALHDPVALIGDFLFYKFSSAK